MIIYVCSCGDVGNKQCKRKGHTVTHVLDFNQTGWERTLRFAHTSMYPLFLTAKVKTFDVPMYIEVEEEVIRERVGDSSE